MIEEVTREELEQELHRKIKLREQDLKENETPEEEPVEEPTRMIGEDSKEEADEPTRMFTGISEISSRRKRTMKMFRKKMHMKKFFSPGRESGKKRR